MLAQRIVPLTLCALLALTGISPCWAQGMAELSKQKKATEQRIVETNKLLSQSASTQKERLEQLAVIEAKISAQEDLINTISKQEAYYQRALVNNKQQIDSLESVVENLKKDYAAFLQKTQFNRSSHSIVVYILASKSFTQMLRRLRYYGEYAAYQRTQYLEIQRQDSLLGLARQALLANHKKAKDLKLENIQSKRSLEETQLAFNHEVSSLKQEESHLKQLLLGEKQRLEKLNAQIEQIIRAEASANRKKQATAENKQLSKRFKSNKGNLPWPVRGGAITRGYGELQSKVFKDVKTTSAGIDILTSSTSSVYPVFSGNVSMVVSLPGGNMVVIVRHGQYLSLYSNLDHVLVRQGEWVLPETRLGTLSHPKGAQQATLHFEIWSGMQSENPVHWLRR